MAPFYRTFLSLFAAVLLILMAVPLQAQLYMGTTGNVSFYSKAPLEDIEAHSNQMSGVIKTDSREVAFSMLVSSFQFKKPLMQRHFNEKYLESHKYPKATFAGTLVEPIDLSVPGTHLVSVQGKLTIHGVAQDRTITGTVVSDGSKLALISEFKVRVADHGVKIPKLVFRNIAEVVDVKMNMTLTKK